MAGPDGVATGVGVSTSALPMWSPFGKAADGAATDRLCHSIHGRRCPIEDSTQLGLGVPWSCDGDRSDRPGGTSCPHRTTHEKYRAEKKRRLLQRAKRLWRNTRRPVGRSSSSKRLHSGSTDAPSPSYHSEARTLLWQAGCPAEYKVNTMLNEMTRSRVTKVWFAAVTLIVVASIALGGSVTVSTGALLLAMSLVPPVIVLMLWPGPQPRTTAEMLYPPDHRG